MVLNRQFTLFLRASSKSYELASSKSPYQSILYYFSRNYPHQTARFRSTATAMAQSQKSKPKPLTAKEVAAHPAFHTNEWDLPPTKSGRCPVAKGRAGGPFDLAWEVHGNGSTKLIWIMGLGSFRNAWKRQTKYFGHTNSQSYSSLVYDNRGMGTSDKPTCRYSTKEMALDLIDLLTSLGWYNPSSTPTRDLNVIGVSMGGMIAQELGLLIPDSIQSLCLVSTAPRVIRTVPFVENLRQRINMFVPREIDVQLDEISHRLFSTSFLAEPDTDEDDPKLNYPSKQDRFACAELHKRADKEGFTRKGFVLQAIAAGWHHKSAEQLKELGDRVGRDRIAVLHGTGDRMLTFRHFELLREELGVGPEYHVWDGPGHVLLWEVEEEFNAVIRKIVERTGGM